MLVLSKQISEIDININQFNNIWKYSSEKDIVLIIRPQSRNWLFSLLFIKRNFKVGLYFEVIWFN